MTQRDPGVYLEDIEYYAGAAVRFPIAHVARNLSYSITKNV